jgi:Ribbon-helix-helix protein, copG family
MIRTQISLEEEAYRRAKAEARQRGISLAEFLRRAVAVTMGHGGGATRASSASALPRTTKTMNAK